MKKFSNFLKEDIAIGQGQTQTSVAKTETSVAKTQECPDLTKMLCVLLSNSNFFVGEMAKRNEKLVKAIDDKVIDTAEDPDKVTKKSIGTGESGDVKVIGTGEKQKELGQKPTQ